MTDRASHLRALSEEYHAEGRHIEAGWIELCARIVPENARREQVEDMREMFFAGVMHLYHIILQMTDDRGKREPTQSQAEYMQCIHAEISEFAQELNCEHNTAGHA